MSDRRSDYQINDATFSVEYGDITRLIADILVSSDDSYLTMGGGVSASLLRAGGNVVAEEAAKHVPLRLGDVAVTSAGRLHAKYIFHVVTIDYKTLEYAAAETLKLATSRCLLLADTLAARTIAFPALGTGVAQVPFHVAAEVMTRTIADHLYGDTQLEKVTLTLLAREGVRARDVNTFYERSVALAAIATESKRLASLLDELGRIADARNKPGLLVKIEELRHELYVSQQVLTAHPETLEQLRCMQEQSGVEQIAQRAIAVSSQGHANEPWDNRELEAQVLRTKLAGLLTQLNIQTSHANRYQIEKAKYGGQLVPPRLEVAIDELAREIATVETQVRGTREQLASLTQR